MSSTFRAYDADGHLTEPCDLWENYIDPKYREGCPKIVIRPSGAAEFHIDQDLVIVDELKPLKPGINTSSIFGARTGAVRSDLAYLEGEAGGFDPHARIAWMDREGFYGSMLYPTMAIVAAHAARDSGRQEAIANAYNRYTADFCAANPDRLFAAAILPTLTIESAFREIENVKKLGMNAVCLRPNLSQGHALHDPFFFPIWERCQDMGIAVAVHGLADGGSLGTDRFNSVSVSVEGAPPRQATCHSFAVEHCFIHTAEMMAAATSFVMAGICDKFPELRVAFVEGGAAWLPGYLDRMDRHFDDVGMNDTGLSTRPSEIFARQCFITFEPEERSIAVLAEYLGPNKFMLSSDYPHSDGFPDAIGSLKSFGLARDVEEALMSAGFMQWYGL